MTRDEIQKFQTADKCHICDKTYTEKDIRVRDHCHITGIYRGSAHQERNLKLKINPENIKIPVIFHNLRGYDSHFIMQQIGKIAEKIKRIYFAYQIIWKNIWLLCLEDILYFLIEVPIRCKNICQNKFNINPGLVEKLIPTLSDKTKYVLHYRNLQLYLDLGLKLKKFIEF